MTDGAYDFHRCFLRKQQKWRELPRALPMGAGRSAAGATVAPAGRARYGRARPPCRPGCAPAAAAGNRIDQSAVLSRRVANGSQRVLICGRAGRTAKGHFLGGPRRGADGAWRREPCVSCGRTRPARARRLAGGAGAGGGHAAAPDRSDHHVGALGGGGGGGGGGGRPRRASTSWPADSGRALSALSCRVLRSSL